MHARLGGEYAFPGGGRSVRRIGYGAMQLPGPGVFGPPRDPDEAVAVVREAVDSGVNHIDTSAYYGPHVANRIIREALYPYPEDLVIVTKLGAKRTEDGKWLPALTRDLMIEGIHDNLRELGLEQLEVVNLRPYGTGADPAEGSHADKLEVMAELQQQGLIKHVGLSNVTATQLAEARTYVDVVCVQNNYNVVHRDDDAFIDLLAEQGVAYVPFYPLGGFTPVQSATLERVAADHGVTPLQAAQAWLLARSPNVLLISGTSQRAHLRENLAVGDIELSAEARAELDAFA